MIKYAVIDIGTNSIKLHITARDAKGNWATILDKSEIARLGEGLQKAGKINPEAMKRNVNAISKMIDITRKEGVQEIIAIGTMALRTASNASEFIEQVRTRFGIDIEIISGEQEASLSYLAVKSGIHLSRRELVIFDVGGGSTEFIFVNNDTIKRKFSLNMGVVRLTEEILKSDPVKEAEYNLALNITEEALTGVQFASNLDQLIGVGGSVTTLGAVRQKMSVYTPETIHGSKLELSIVKSLISLFKSKTIEERKKIDGLPPKRADVILAGSILVYSIMKKARVNSIIISDRGIRHGLIIDRFGY